LRAAIPEARRPALGRLLDADLRGTLAGLLPGLGVGEPAPSGSSGSPAELVSGGEPLADALGAILQELAAVAPQLLLLDDVQWGDPQIWPVLDALRPRLVGARVLIALSGRIDEVRRSHAASERLEAWDRDGIPILALRGLDDAALAELSSGVDGRVRTADEVTALAAASGGNPLLALALVDAGEDVAALARPDPATRADLDRLFEHRLAALSAPARAALEAAAVSGQRVDAGVWADVSGDPDLDRRAAELEAAGLLQPDGDAFVFRHDTLRSLVVWGLPAERKTTLDRAALESRRRRTPDDVLRLLYHAEQLGDDAEIAVQARRAGDDALRSLAFAAAAQHYGRALAALPPDARAERFAALLGRVRALEVLADRAAQRVDVQELEDLAEHLDETARLDAAMQRATFHSSVGEYAACARVVERALRSPGLATQPARRVALLTMLGRIQREQGQTAAARATLAKAGALARRSGDRHGAAMALELLAGIAWRTGDHRTAAAQHAEAAAMFEATGDRRRAANALNSVGTARWSLGDYEGARAAHERSLATCRAVGDRRGEGDNLDNLGGVAWALGDFEQALELYGSALAIRRGSQDPWGVTISLTNLADTWALLGDSTTALTHYDEALAVDRTIGVQRNEASAWSGRGRALLDAGRSDEAVVAIRRALDLHRSIGDRDGLADGLATLAHASLASGDVEAARAASEEALGLLAADDRPSLRQWVRLVAWEVATAVGDPAAAAEQLALATTAMDELLAALPDDARDRVRARFPVHRATDAARVAAGTRTVVELPRVAVPLGRAVEASETVPVTWTIVDPGDARVADAAARRRLVLERLVAEAAAQDAEPTDDDLATALGVSRRTILRDAEILAAEGRPLATRARARRAPGVG
jgi:tetratricopeptide (TPR) repeat protein